MSKFRQYGQHIILSLLLAALTVFGLWQFGRAKKLEYAQDMAYRQIFTEFTGYVDDVQTQLMKSRLVSDPGRLVDLSGELYRSAAAAKASLCSLPLGEVSVARTAEFLSQVGDYAHSVSMRVLKGGEMTDGELDTIAGLSKYARELQSGLDNLLTEMNNGNLSLSRESARRLNGGATALAGSMADLEEEIHDYPSLVYDGPFSQHVMNKSPVWLEGRADVSEETALETARSFIGPEARLTGTGEGKIPSYYFENGTRRLELSKAGGCLLWLLDDRPVGERTLELEEAKRHAADFLRRNGYYDMTESYYDLKDDCAVLNYAWTQNGYTVYPDLVKVKVALDTGEVVGFEGRGFVMNHQARTIPEPKITPEEAVKMVSRGAPIESTSYAVIPLDGGDEAFCYQLRGSLDGKNFLIYINTQTGAEEDVMILLESDTGVLAV